ncbi:LPS-assembly protein LptD [Yoonia sp. 208BN28-4]|uniref:LPS-assembly protein LptD n=1 Tax=Yoonia sp. 208BN28-4 TaxID=3126505 RepID=UPI0030AA0A23
MMRWLALLLAFLPGLATAQGTATLIADSVVVTADEQLIAEGNIEAFYDGTRLSARRIVYDRASDRLMIDGPIFITDGTGNLITADRASLDPRLENGLLRGARLVLDRQLQLAATQIARVDGRYADLRQVAATSCQICGQQAPLWDIRADRVVHDQDARQLYFDNAVLRVRGLPILWLPYMRLPDPTLDRATGLLIPRLRTTDQLGTGLKLPYFIRLGDHRDLTLTPYVSAKTRTLEARYREAFINGNLLIEGAVTDDTLQDDIRSFLFTEGSFDLRSDFKLDFTLQTVSDPAYLLDYGFGDTDRLESQISLTRVRADDLFQTQLTFFESLRDNEVDTALPPVVAAIGYDRRIDLGSASWLDLTLGADVAVRTNKDDARDVARIGAGMRWQRNFQLAGGVLMETSAGLQANYFQVADDPSIDNAGLQTIPHVATTLRWPLIRRGAGGVTDLLEPTLALAWSDQFGDTPPNEDSTRAELDRGNLFALSRFAGEDRTETGLRAAAGLSWTRHMAAGTTSNLTFGRIFRDEAISDFSASSGLSGQRSDWLLSGQIATADGFFVEARSLFDDDFDITQGTARINWQTADLSLDAAYVFQAADGVENRPDAVSEWRLDTAVQVTDAWRIGFDGRYDIAAGRPARTALELEWQNECVTVSLSVSRRFTSSTTVDPSTDVGLGVSLNGFSAGRSGGGPATGCTN